MKDGVKFHPANRRKSPHYEFMSEGGGDTSMENSRVNTIMLSEADPHTRLNRDHPP